MEADFSSRSIIFTTCNFTFISKCEILAYVVNFLSLLLREEQGEGDIRKQKQNNALFYCFKYFDDIWQLNYVLVITINLVKIITSNHFTGVSP